MKQTPLCDESRGEIGRTADRIATDRHSREEILVRAFDIVLEAGLGWRELVLLIDELERRSGLVLHGFNPRPDHVGR